MGKLVQVRVKFWVRVRVELGLGLYWVAKVVGFTAFKLFKFLVSFEKKSTSRLFHCF